MSRQDGSGFGWFLFGFLMGGLVGAAVALAFAPQSGEETRRLLREKGVELRGRAEETYGQVRERVGELREQAETQVGQVREQVQQVASRLRRTQAPAEEPEETA